MSSPENKSGAASSRLLCYIAALIFLGCGVLFWFAPMQMHVAVRGVVAGFNAIIALAVFLYGRQLKDES
jgi:hypothetical protein